MIIINKVILMGRLTRDVEVRYSQSATPVAVARYGLAVRRQYKREGDPDVDFINIISFGKAAEFAQKYFAKGQQVAIVGRLQVRQWTDEQGNKRITTEVIAEEQHFAESKRDSQVSNQGGFTPVHEDEEDLPF